MYYIINGRIRLARLKCNNVNKVKELSVTQYSEIRECSSRFQTIEFSNGFVGLNSIDSLDRKLFHDVLGVVVDRSGVLVTGHLKRRVTTIADETNERVSVTLWGDFAEIDGLCLDNAENCKTIVAFCNMKVSEFKGTLGFGCTAATCVILNPKFEKATQLEQWYSFDLLLEFDNTKLEQVVKEDKFPTSCETADSKLEGNNSVEENTEQSESQLSSNNEITNGDRGEGLEVKKQENSSDGNGEGEEREKQQNTITVQVLEAGKFFFGCSAENYMPSIREKPENSYFYKKMLAAEGQKYYFLVKNYHEKTQEERKTEMVVEEMHLIGNAVVIDDEETPQTSSARGKRALEENKEDDIPSAEAGKETKQIKI